MKKMKLMYAITVVVASASLLLSSCNQLNNEINNLNKGGEIVQDPTKLTISGVIDNYHGEFDELNALKTDVVGDGIYNSKLGSCKVNSKGEFSITIQAMLDDNDSLGLDTTRQILGSIFPFPRSVEDRKSRCCSFIGFDAFKNGKVVGGLQKVSMDLPDHVNGVSIYIYSSKSPFAVKRSFVGTFTGLNATHILDYKINTGWNEIAFVRITDGTTSFTNTIPSNFKWIFTPDSNTSSTSLQLIKGH